MERDGKLTVKELAAVLNIHEETVRKLVKTKQLPCLQIKKRILFDFEELVIYFKQLEQSNT